MKMKCCLRLLPLLWVVMASVCIVSCSDTEETGQKGYTEVTAYDYFKETGTTQHQDFSSPFMDLSDVEMLLCGSWSRDTVAYESGDVQKLVNRTIDISKDSIYTETLGKVEKKHRITQWRLHDSKLLLTLDNDSVIQYDSVVWNVDRCCVVSKDKDGGRYKDYKRKWADSDDVKSWCSIWVVMN